MKATLKVPLLISILVFAMTGYSKAGENFKTFIKGCDMTWADTNSYGGFPWGGSGGSDPYKTLANHGINYVRLSVWYNPKGSRWLDEAELLKQATLLEGDGLKLEVDIMYSDSSFSSPYPGPAAWYDAYQTAIANNPNYQINSNTVALEDSVYNYTYRLLTDLKNNDTPADMVSIGNEINNHFVWIPTATPLYYQLIYEGAQAAKDVDSTIGVVLHLANIGTSEETDCANLAWAKKRFGIANHIPFDCFGFSFHAFTNPLSNPNYQTNGQPIGIKQAVWKENFGQYGKYLLVQECAYPYTLDSQYVAPNWYQNGTWYHPRYTSTSSFYDSDSIQCDASGCRQYYNDLMSIVANSSSGLGVGVVAWAADDVAGWGRHPSEFSFAFWRSDNGDLVATRNGYNVLGIFKNSYTISGSMKAPHPLISSSQPTGFSLEQNYPNPFNPTTVITYSVAREQAVTLKVYNVLGQQVATLVDARENPGYYEATFDANRFASGIYFYVLRSNGFRQTRKMVLLK